MKCLVCMDPLNLNNSEVSVISILYKGTEVICLISQMLEDVKVLDQ